MSISIKPRFITFEGIDGCGKSTQAELLNDYLLNNNIQSTIVREPGGTSISENRNTKSIGFSFNYRRWKINYGIYFHENSAILGIPQFLDVRRYL